MKTIICKYFDAETCPNNCTYDWIKCDLCEEYIEPNNDDINGYVIDSAVICCDTEDIEDMEMKICLECFEKIKKLKKVKSK